MLGVISMLQAFKIFETVQEESPVSDVSPNTTKYFHLYYCTSSSIHAIFFDTNQQHERGSNARNIKL